MATSTHPERESVFIKPDHMRQVFNDILLKTDVPEAKARMCAEVFTNNSLEGVLSHGVNRFHRFVTTIQNGLIDPKADPTCTKSVGAIEQWHGHSGLGITNAMAGSERAIELAAQFGMGCVALAFTNHWMRAGAYARHATSKGFAFMAWSNTIRNTPPWGAIDPRLGNNPLTIGIPNGNAPIVLDIAMSQYSYGALENYKIQEKSLPVHGGYDSGGKLSKRAADIIESRRTLPIGFWKGSGLSLLLDMLGVVLSGGLSVAEISRQGEEKNLTQIFIAFDLKSLHNFSSIQSSLNAIIADFKLATPEQEGIPIRYPGENIQVIREKNMRDGIEVNRQKWDEIINLHG